MSKQRDSSEKLVKTAGQFRKACQNSRTVQKSLSKQQDSSEKLVKTAGQFRKACQNSRTVQKSSPTLKGISEQNSAGVIVLPTPDLLVLPTNISGSESRERKVS